MKKYIVGLLVGILLSGTVVFAANYLYHANEVSYTSNNKNWDVDNVKDALDELYAKIDSGVTVCSSSTSTPIFKYEAAGVEDDYVYICEEGEWVKLNKAGLRWDGYIFNRGVYDSKYFSTTWKTSRSSGYLTPSVSFDNNRILLKAVSAAQAEPTSYYVMDKKLPSDSPCVIRILANKGGTSGVWNYTNLNIGVKSSNAANYSNVLAQAVAVGNDEYRIQIPSNLVGSDLYLAFNFQVIGGSAMQANQQITLDIKEIQMIFE
ncbi:MAG: hypothetical protein IJ715_02715 [Bacilli bacterium]|nr:hypothetical protein [Bacilli bacterium]